MASLNKRDRHYQAVIQFERRVYKIPGFLLDSTGKRLSEELGRNIEKMLQTKATGNIPPDLRRYVETLPKRIRQSLARQGLIDAATEGKNLAEHIADYCQALAAKGVTPYHVESTKKMISKTVERCSFKMLGDVTSAKIRTYLADRRASKIITNKQTGMPSLDAEGKPIMKPGLSARRHNAIIAAWGGFIRWCMREHRIFENPLINVPRLNERIDRRHVRRALGPEEVRLLIEATTKEKDLAGMTGPERAMLYRLALETGLRLNELSTLTRDCLDLEARTLKVKAGYSKHRREDILPMRPALIATLQAHLEHKAPQARVFDMPTRYATLRSFYSDLEAAGIARINESGQVVDFHALRHTFISSLCHGGVHPKVAQELARHSTITLTMDKYTHTLQGAGSAALLTLPNYDLPSSQLAKATGTGSNLILRDAATSSLPQTSGVYSGVCVGHNYDRNETTRDNRTNQNRNERTDENSITMGVSCDFKGEMPGTGIEPAHLAIREPKSRASANSATRAIP